MAIKDGQPRYILTPTELAAVVNKSLPAITKSFKDQSIRLMARRSGLPPDHVREYLEKEGADYSFRVISHLNLRGGCSKTTATVSLATRAKQYGHRVCILDLDSQASASLAFKVVVGENHPSSSISSMSHRRFATPSSKSSPISPLFQARSITGYSTPRWQISPTSKRQPSRTFARNLRS